jgi:hypothetical protein
MARGSGDLEKKNFDMKIFGSQICFVPFTQDPYDQSFEVKKMW